jgi:hypothetical protein
MAPSRERKETTARFRNESSHSEKSSKRRRGFLSTKFELGFSKRGMP